MKKVHVCSSFPAGITFSPRLLSCASCCARIWTPTYICNVCTSVSRGALHTLIPSVCPAAAWALILGRRACIHTFDRLKEKALAGSDSSVCARATGPLRFGGRKGGTVLVSCGRDFAPPKAVCWNLRCASQVGAPVLLGATGLAHRRRR